MKKVISIFLAIVFVAVSAVGLCSFSDDVFLKTANIIYDDNGIGYSIIGSDTKDILRSFGSSEYSGISYSGQDNNFGKLNFVEYNDELVTSSDIPATHDSRTGGIVTSAKSQGSSGCCWAFSAISALETDAVKRGGLNLSDADFSESHLVWFSYNSGNDPEDFTVGEKYISDSPFSTGGSWLRSSSTLSKWFGIANESDYRFYQNLSMNGNYDSSSAYDTGSGFVLENAVVFNSDSEVKNWILDHGSCSCAIYYNSEFENKETNAYYNKDYSASGNDINHMVTIIGWDDNFAASNFIASPPSDGAWLIKDSWGGKHDSGYYWISYCESSMEYFVGFSARNKGNLLHNYTYNGAGFTTMVSNGADTRAANVFKAKSKEVLKSISCFLMQNTDSVTVEIYRNLLSNYSSPIGGSLVSSFDVNNLKAGYHTIYLPNDVALNKDTYFSVVIYYTINNSSPYIPIEADGIGSDVKYKHSPGQSFIYVGNEWYDTSSVLDHGKGNIYGNVFIQAFSECEHDFQIVSNTATCTESGYSVTQCVLCGAEGNTSYVEASGHDFSEWSPYNKDGKSNRYVSTRECHNCGLVEERSYTSGSNIITLGNLLSMWFSRLFRFFSFNR